AAAQLCGNGAIDGGEDCDLGTLNNASCQSQGFAVGVLSCTDGCVFDTSGCSAMRFADNADGTITDNKTRLMWEKKIGLNGTINHSNLQDADNIYRWSGTCTGDGTRCQPNAASEAACLLGVENSTDGCARCISGTCSVTPGTIWQWLAALNAAAYGGYSDWRMPTLSELQGLIDYADTTPPAINGALHGASCGGACTDATNAVCACTQPTYHWSASTYVSAPSNAWAVSFQEGFAPTQPKASAGGWYVRAVRGGP
ncbi:MAG TPA: DUF1566 domain-containing protein, partial [Terriglobales bacterium]|nr:DUF1566 domain-containing protein [Terriglobales bacterium]